MYIILICILTYHAITYFVTITPGTWKVIYGFVVEFMVEEKNGIGMGMGMDIRIPQAKRGVVLYIVCM